MISRRRFLASTALSAATLPLLARAQRAGRRYRVGILLPVDTSAANHLPAIRERLAAQGFVEGRNLEIDVRYARTNPDAAQELLARAIGVKVPQSILLRADRVIE